jgi:hypothetical protein
MPFLILLTLSYSGSYKGLVIGLMIFSGVWSAKNLSPEVSSRSCDMADG